MEVLFYLNKWTNNILLNITAIRLLYFFVNYEKSKFNTSNTNVFGFILILILDNWSHQLAFKNENFYYSFVASVFLAHFITNKISPFAQICTATTLGTTLIQSKSSAILQVSFILSMLVLLHEIKNNLLKSSNQRRITVVLIPITAYIYFAAQEYTLAQVGQDWANSKLLIYFSIGDYIVFTTMIIIINANLRRLFFN